MKPKKSIKSRYAVKNINPQYFVSVDVSNTGRTNEGGVEGGVEDGVVFMHYIMGNTGTISYDAFSWEETTEEKAERIREERNEKIKRIFGD